ncbi:MAG TPA: thioredoxin [Pseudomonadales bacterium]
MNTTTPDDTARVFDVSAASFERDVVERSRSTAVLLDFWAEWCGPCKALGPILEKLADAYGGSLVLAKVNVDREPMLAQQFQIRSIPTVMLVKDGRIVGGFPGALPESQVRQFLAQHGVEPAAAGEAPAASEPPAERVARLRAAVAEKPDDAERRFELALALTDAGEVDEAAELIEALPANLGADQRTTRAWSRIRFVRALRDAPPVDALERAVSEQPDDSAARHQLGIALIEDGRPREGLDQLLELLRRDRNWQDGRPRQALVDAFNVIDDEALVREYRRRMTALLF